MAGVVIVNGGATVILDVVILFSEIFIGGGWDQRVELADRDFFDCRLEYKRTCGDARAETDDQNGFGVWMKQRGKVAEHALKAHIGESGGSFYFPRDVEIAAAVGRFGDGHRIVAAFADIQRVSGVRLQNHASAVSDGQPWDGCDVGDHPDNG